MQNSAKYPKISNHWIRHRKLLVKSLSFYTIFVLAFTSFYSSAFAVKTGEVFDEALIKEFDSRNYPDGRKYNEVCWLTTHNAFASYGEEWNIYAQQRLTLEDQFRYGVRSFMIDLYWYDPDWTNWVGVNPPSLDKLGPSSYVVLCHETDKNNNCAISIQLRPRKKGLMLAVDYFKRIRVLLESNPDAIVTLHLENRLNGFTHKTPEAAIHDLLSDKEVGLMGYLYLPSGKIKTRGSDATKYLDDWPTLGEMRKTGKRLVIFSDESSDGMLNVASYRETAYDLSSEKKCEMRGEGRDRSKTRKLFVFNHFYKYSIDTGVLNDSFEEANSYEKIFERLLLCISDAKHEILPNFIAVDFVEAGREGGALQAVVNLNKVPADRFGNVNVSDLYGVFGKREKWVEEIGKEAKKWINDNKYIQILEKQARRGREL